MPPKLVRRTAHRPLYDGNDCIPPSLREAMLAFVLTVAVRKLREPGPHHNSMLVHVVRYTNVQQLVAEQVGKALREIAQRLQNGDGDRTPAFWMNCTTSGFATSFLPTVNVSNWPEKGRRRNCPPGKRSAPV